MKTLNLLFAAAASLALASCSTVKTYKIAAKSGTYTQGTVKLTEKNGKVTMDVSAFELTPGQHAMHIHEKGDCSALDASSAGGHWNPTATTHGKWGVNGHHMGDIGNLAATKDGKARMIFTTDKWCLGCNDETKNIIGKSLIIHANVDDFSTQPTGNAGGRVGCVEIK